MSTRTIRLRLTPAQYDVLIDAVAYFDTVLEDEALGGDRHATAKRQCLDRASDRLVAAWQSRARR